jgi:hypothetical protein
VADYGNVETKLAGIPDDQGVRRILKDIFRYTLADTRFGRSTDGESAKNFGGGFFKGTTPGTANQEFSITHSFGRTPYLLIPVLPLDQVNATIVRLQLSKAADPSRVYLKSPDTSAVFYVYIEG